MKNPFKVLLTILIAYMFMLTAPMAYADTTSDYNQKVSESTAKIDDCKIS